MMLSDVKISKVLASIKVLQERFGYTDEEIESIVFEKDNNHVEEKCDIGFIFGGISMIPYRVDEGIKLYEHELVSKLLVSGGVGFMNTDRITPEAYKMRDYLLEKGIPKEDIIVEDRSRNTIENIKNSFELLNEKYDYLKLTYALITSDFHVRRCLGLFEQALGRGDTIVGSGILDGVKDINSWANNSAGRSQIIKEAWALSLYAKQGKIKDIEIPDVHQLKRK